MRFLCLLFLFCFNIISVKAADSTATVVVFSGGGAKALAHVGMMQYLEEEHVKIDAVGGASMGAFVAALYASGYSANDIKKFFLNPDIQWHNGSFANKYGYNGFLFNWDNTSFLNFNLPSFSSIVNFIPTNIIASEPLFLGLIQFLGPQWVASKYNFDNLFLPFRCYAVAVGSHKNHAFRSGNLPKSLMASMAYPFYLPPQQIGSEVFLDGGIYDNFPVLPIRKEFKSKYFIGSQTSLDADTSDNNSFAQLIRLIKKDEPDTIVSDLSKGTVIIKHENVAMNYGTFQFDNAHKIIELGYQNAKDNAKLIASFPKYKTQELEKRRQNYQHQVPPLLFSKLLIQANTKGQYKYLSSLLKMKRKVWTIDKWLPLFSKVFTDPRFTNFSFDIRPDENDSNHHILILDNGKLKRHSIDLGGGIMAGQNGGIYNLFLDYGYSYFLLGTLMKTKLEAGMSNFYSYIALNQRIDITKPVHSFLEFSGLASNTNYYNWRSFFASLRNLNFLTSVSYEGESKWSIPVARRLILSFSSRYVNSIFSYYNSGNIRVTGDSSDLLNTSMLTPILASITYNTFNHKQYPSKGTLFYVVGSHNILKETHLYLSKVSNFPGVTPEKLDPNAKLPYRFVDARSYFFLEAYLEHYSYISNNLQIGFFIQGVFSNLNLRRDYYTSLAVMPRFAPVLEMQYLLNDDYISPAFIGSGIKLVINPIRSIKNISLRINGALLYKKYNFERSELNNELLKFNPKKAWEFNVIDIVNTPVLASSMVWSNKYLPVSVNFNYYAQDLFNIAKDFFQVGRVHFYIALGYVLNYKRRNFYQ